MRKSEIRNPKSETNSNNQNPNDQNSFENLKIRILKIVSSFEFRYSNLIILVFAFCVLSLGKERVLAQASLPLTVAPSRQEILINPGETTTITVKFLNQADTPVSGPVKVADFIVEDKSGSPTFLNEGPNVTSAASISPKYSAASWVTLPYDRITIAAKNRVSVQAKISVPKNALPGGRYIALYFEPGGELPASAKATVGEEAISPVTVRLAGLIYLRIAGPVEESARAVQFTAPKFLEYGPIPVTTEIINLGNYHIRPVGPVTLTSLLGKVVDQELLKEQNIFPEASRIYENKVGGKWLFGKYKLELAASYGETGKVITATVFVWVIPWKAIVIVTLAIIIAILLASLIYHRFVRREEELEEKIEDLEEKLEKK